LLESVSDRHGIQMDVAGQVEQIAIAAYRGSMEAPLHQMPRPAMLGVEIQRIGRLEPVHKHTQIRSGGFDQQVEMVRHQAIQIETNSVLFRRFAQPLHKSPAIRIVQEYRCPGHATLRHMIEPPLKLDASLSRHGHIFHHPHVRCKKIVNIVSA
jgi:hypothetical protein